MRYLSLLGLLWLPLSLPVQAEVTPPDVVVERTADEMLTVLRQRKEELRGRPEAIRALVEQILVPRVDLELMSRYALGVHWRELSPEQRQRFTTAFKDMLIRFYASSMLEYLDYQVRFFPLRMQPDDRITTVRSQFYLGQKPPIDVNYRVALRGGQWKAFDVMIDNISVVTSYRGSFQSTIAKEGFDVLLQKMESWGSKSEIQN